MTMLANAIAGILIGWQGLTGTETFDIVSQAIGPFKKIHDPVDSERQQQRFRVTAIEREAPPYLIELWVLHGQKSITLIEYDTSSVHDIETTLQSYGAPELVLDDKRTTAGAAVKEYVYASRGVTLSIAEPYSWSETKERHVVHVQLYRAGSLDYYWRYIGPGFELRPSPRR